MSGRETPPTPSPSLLPPLAALAIGGAGVGVVMTGWQVACGAVVLAASLAAAMLLLAAIALDATAPKDRLRRVAFWSLIGIDAQLAAALLAHLLSLRLGSESWPPSGIEELPKATFFIAAILAAGAGLLAELPASAIRAGRHRLRAITAGMQSATGLAAFAIATASYAYVLGTGAFGAGTHAAFPSFHALAAWKIANLLGVAVASVHALAAGMADRPAALSRTRHTGRLWLLAAAAVAAVTIAEAVLLAPRG